MVRTIRKNKIMPEWAAGEVAGGIFRYLEANPHRPQSERVELILDLLSRLGENERDFFSFTQLREPLRRYEWRYGLTLSSAGLSARLVFTKEMSEEDEWEHGAVRFLMSLVPHQIYRLRRCAYYGCRGWFFAAKRDDQEFCKRGACRQNYYDSDPVRRKQKAEKMKENREWHKKDRQRGKETVGI
jgi:hypothetical protein